MVLMEAVWSEETRAKENIQEECKIVDLGHCGVLPS